MKTSLPVMGGKSIEYADLHVRNRVQATPRDGRSIVPDGHITGDNGAIHRTVHGLDSVPAQE
jgi:hypothetical protein